MKYSATFGSFVRGGDYPLEAEYIFNSVEELQQWGAGNQGILHDGLLKIVKEEDNQTLYWCYNKQFYPLCDLKSFNNFEALNEVLKDNDLIKKLMNDLERKIKDKIKSLQEELDRTQHGVGLNGDGSFDRFNVSDTNYLTKATSVLSCIKALDKYLKEFSDKSVNLEGIATEEWVNQAITNAKSEILGGAGEDYDTLKEIETWVTEHQDLYEALISGIVTKEEISDMATQAWVNAQNFLTEHQSLEEYSKTSEIESKITDATNDMATQTWVESQQYLKEHQSLEDYYTKSEIDDKEFLTEIPEEYAKTDDIQNWVENKHYLTDHQSLDDYYTKGQVDEKIETIEANGGYDDTPIKNRIQSLETKLDGVDKVADDQEVIKQIFIPGVTDIYPTDGCITLNGDDFINLNLSTGDNIDISLDASNLVTKDEVHSPDGSIDITSDRNSALALKANTNYLATKQSVDDLKQSVDLLVSGETANDAFDTLKEVDTWIKEHEDKATSLVSDINNLNKWVDDRKKTYTGSFVTAIRTTSDVPSSQEMRLNITYGNWQNTNVSDNHVSLPYVTSTQAGVMPASDKVKLDSIDPQQIYTKEQINSRIEGVNTSINNVWQAVNETNSTVQGHGSKLDTIQEGAWSNVKGIGITSSTFGTGTEILNTNKIASLLFSSKDLDITLFQNISNQNSSVGNTGIVKIEPGEEFVSKFATQDSINNLSNSIGDVSKIVKLDNDNAIPLSYLTKENVVYRGGMGSFEAGHLTINNISALNSISTIHIGVANGTRLHYTSGVIKVEDSSVTITFMYDDVLYSSTVSRISGSNSVDESCQLSSVSQKIGTQISASTTAYKTGTWARTTTLNSAIGMLRNKVETQDSSISSLTEDVSSLTSSNSDLSSKVNSLNTNVTKIGNTINSQGKAIEDLQNPKTTEIEFTYSEGSYTVSSDDKAKIDNVTFTRIKVNEMTGYFYGYPLSINYGINPVIWMYDGNGALASWTINGTKVTKTLKL